MPARRLWSIGAGLVLGAALATPARGSSDESVRELVARAAAIQLWTDPGWLKLGHYRNSPFGSSSAVDGPGFFLSPRGKDDARAELEATLEAFHDPVRLEALDRHPRCLWPARFHWLDQKLGLDSLPPIRCPAFEHFLHAGLPDRVWLLYAANSVDNPVSAFGHTFLHLEAKGRDLALEYRAETDTNNPLWYAFKGLVGLFEGRYYRDPLGDKLREYLRGELRDVWEYELVLSDEERRQLVAHLWELSRTHFDYYYMTENCSYGMLALLDAAAPRLALIERTSYVVLPVDTLRIVTTTPGLVGRIRYHPAEARRGRAVPWREAPHTGHESMRALFGAGLTTQTDDGFVTLGYRVALHDLTDPPQGQPALAQIQFMDVRLRWELERRRLTLNEITFAELMVLHPLATRVAPSWRARAFGQRWNDPGCESEDCFGHGLNGAIGLTLGAFDDRAALFLLADARLLVSGDFDGIGGSFVRGAVGPLAGLHVEGPGQLVGQVLGGWWYLPDQAYGSTYELRATLRGGLARNVALGFDVRVQPSATELALLSYLYF